jgi:hypothetical protein
MSSISRELCPHCIDFTQVAEEKLILREEEIYLVEKVIHRCQSCHQELVNVVNLRFKTKMG